MAIRGDLVDEPGRHEPPAGRRRKRPASPARAVLEPPAVEAPAEEDEEVWTEDQLTTLREMKSNKKAKYNWDVVAKRVQKNVTAAKEKWLEIQTN